VKREKKKSSQGEHRTRFHMRGQKIQAKSGGGEDRKLKCVHAGKSRKRRNVETQKTRKAQDKKVSEKEVPKTGVAAARGKRTVKEGSERRNAR